MHETKSVVFLAVLLTGLLACTQTWSEEIDDCNIGREHTKIGVMCEIKKIMQVNDRHQLDKRPEERFRPVYLKCDNNNGGAFEWVNENREHLKIELKAIYIVARLTYISFYHVNPDGTRVMHYEGKPDEVAASHPRSSRFVEEILTTVRNKICHGSKTMKEVFAQVLRENELQLKN